MGEVVKNSGKLIVLYCTFPRKHIMRGSRDLCLCLGLGLGLVCRVLLDNRGGGSEEFDRRFRELGRV